MTSMTMTAPNFASDQARWQAVQARDRRAEGHFWLGVMTTGIYCRPGCPARTPKRENVVYLPTPLAAQKAGFRACKRCDPDQAGPEEKNAGLIAAACRQIEEAETPPTLNELAAEARLTGQHFARLFKAQLGISPKEYTHAVRTRRLEDALRSAGSVTEALYEAGFNAPSRAYEAAGKRLGMQPGDVRRRGAGQEIRYAIASSWLGRTLIAATQKGLCCIQLGDEDAALIAELRQRFPKAEIECAEPGSPYQAWIDQALAAIDRPAEAHRLPLDIQGTAFQEQVWRALTTIPPGETVTYSEVAEKIGRPTATRAVAAACGANKLAIFIPCHRVIGKDGALTGYRWGTDRKAKLLEREKG